MQQAKIDSMRAEKLFKDTDQFFTAARSSLKDSTKHRIEKQYIAKQKPLL
jgi:hypothetical protein